MTRGSPRVIVAGAVLLFVLGVAPSAAGKWHRAFSRSGSMSLARIGGSLGFAIDPHGEWSRKQARTRPWIRVRAMPRVPFR